MTRVEKYRKYREEISTMKVESLTSKTVSAREISEVGEDSLDYSDVMNIHTKYTTNPYHKKKHEIHIRKDQIIYCLIAFGTIAIILIALILVGINLWR